MPVRAGKEQFKDAIDLLLPILNSNGGIVNAANSSTFTAPNGMVLISRTKYNAMATLAKEAIDLDL